MHSPLTNRSYTAWWPGRLRRGWRCSVFSTLLTFLLFLVVSGPHRVHHLPERLLHHADGHTHESETPHETPEAPPFDCLALFVLQHNLVTTELSVCLPSPLLSTKALRTAWLSLASTAAPSPVYARAPPLTLL